MQTTRIFLLVLMLGPLFLAGCASQYVVLLTNGQRYTAMGKPHLEQANGQFNFVFMDVSGNTNTIPSGDVREVVPASEIKPAQ